MDSEFLLRLAGEALPELSYLNGGRVPVGCRVKWFELSLERHGELMLRDVRIKLPAGTASAASFSSSPLVRGTAANLLSGKIFRTESVDRPFWRVDFDQPTRVSQVGLNIQYGPPGEATYDLCGSWEDVDGKRGTFAFVSGARFREQISNLRAAILEGRQVHVGSAALDRFLEALERQVANISGVLDSGTADFAALRAGRREALERLNELSLDADAMLQMGGLQGASLLIRALIWRGADKSYGEPAERRAAAMYLASRMLGGALAPLKMMKIFRRMLRSMTVAALEQELSELFVAFGGQRDAVPIMLRKHGMSPSWLVSHRRQAAAKTAEIIRAVEQIGFPAFINYGTLLGAVRDGQFIRHDDDVDISYLSKASNAEEVVAELKMLAARLTALGFPTKFSKTKLLHTQFPGLPVVFDIWPAFEQVPGELTMHMQALELRTVPKSAIVPLGTVELEGQRLAAPGDPQTHLRLRYGGDWLIPNPYFDLPWTKGGKVAVP
ncbi:LicD family protein [Sphingomonas sp. ID0503]|uniref:LicD family protein n=1 Tax=Sphingomonas sp. ID0503 TaxID=3399691 RepID=UPI003AFACA67